MKIKKDVLLPVGALVLVGGGWCLLKRKQATASSANAANTPTVVLAPWAGGDSTGNEPGGLGQLLGGTAITRGNNNNTITTTYLTTDHSQVSKGEDSLV